MASRLPSLVEAATSNGPGDAPASEAAVEFARGLRTVQCALGLAKRLCPGDLAVLVFAPDGRALARLVDFSGRVRSS